MYRAWKSDEVQHEHIQFSFSSHKPIGSNYAVKVIPQVQ